MFAGFSNSVFAQLGTKDSLIQALGRLNSAASINKSLDFFLFTELSPALNTKYNNKIYSDILDKTCLWINKNGTLSQKLRSQFYLCHYPNHLDDIEMIKKLTKLGSYDEFRQLKEYALSLFVLKFLYYKSEQFNEILEIIPILYAENKKYDNFLYIKDGENYDMGRMYYEVKNYPQAVIFFRKYLNQNQENNLIFKASINNDIALSFYRFNKSDSALKYFNKALVQIKTATKLKKGSTENLSYITYFKNVVSSNKAAIVIDEGKYQQALPFLYNQIRGGIHFKENHITISGYFQLAEVMFYINKPDSALAYLDSAFSVLNRFSYNTYFRKALDLKAKCYLLKGDMKQANFYFKKLQRFIDSIETKKVNFAYATATAKYQSKLKEEELRDIKQKISIEKTANKSQRIALLLASVILLLLLFYSINLRRNKRRIAKQNIVINESLLEKEILLKEIHHRVKNNLQVISGLIQIQASKIKIPEVKEMLNESERYIESMSMVHQMLYKNENLRIIPMHNYLNELCSKILESSMLNQIKHSIDIDNIDLKIDFAIPIGLMVSEMTTNSLKHAFRYKSGNIQISLKKTSETQFIFSYHDDGKGLPEVLARKGDKTLGLKLITMLADEIDGDIIIENRNGFYLQIIFPASN
jgi:two-component sensor histidine kinase